MEERILDKYYFNNVALFGDDFGIEQLVKYIDKSVIKCIVGASVRPQYHEKLNYIANSLNIPFFVQPKYNSKEYDVFLKNLEELKLDILFCNSYSMIIRDDLRKIFNENCINIHHSLLPKNRGSNPIQWTLIKGEKTTGVTIHYMDSGIDSGDIIAQYEIAIAIDDTWITLKEKTTELSERLLQSIIIDILQNKNARRKQNEFEASTNKRLNHQFPKIDFKTMNDSEVYNLIRAQVSPLKGAYIELNNDKRYMNQLLTIEKIKILREKYEE